MLNTPELRRIVFEAVAAYVPRGTLERVEVEPYINSVNEVGLRFTLVMSDDEPSAGEGDAIIDAMLVASDRLAEAGETRVPTFVFVTDRELADSGEPDT